MDNELLDINSIADILIHMYRKEEEKCEEGDEEGICPCAHDPDFHTVEDENAKREAEIENEIQMLQEEEFNQEKL